MMHSWGPYWVKQPVMTGMRVFASPPTGWEAYKTFLGFDTASPDATITGAGVDYIDVSEFTNFSTGQPYTPFGSESGAITLFKGGSSNVTITLNSALFTSFEFDTLAGASFTLYMVLEDDSIDPYYQPTFGASGDNPVSFVQLPDSQGLNRYKGIIIGGGAFSLFDNFKFIYSTPATSYENRFDLAVSSNNIDAHPAEFNGVITTYGGTVIDTVDTYNAQNTMVFQNANSYIDVGWIQKGQVALNAMPDYRINLVVKFTSLVVGTIFKYVSTSDSGTYSVHLEAAMISNGVNGTKFGIKATISYGGVSLVLNTSPTNTLVTNTWYSIGISRKYRNYELKLNGQGGFGDGFIGGTGALKVTNEPDPAPSNEVGVFTIGAPSNSFLGKVGQFVIEAGVYN